MVDLEWCNFFTSLLNSVLSSIPRQAERGTRGLATLPLVRCSTSKKKDQKNCVHYFYSCAGDHSFMQECQEGSEVSGLLCCLTHINNFLELLKLVRKGSQMCYER